MNPRYLLQRCPWLRFLSADDGASASTGAAASEEPKSDGLGGTPDEIPPSFDMIGATQEPPAEPAKKDEEPPAAEEQEKKETTQEPPAAKTETKPEPKKEDEPANVPTDEEIDAIHPPEGASQRTINNWNEFKTAHKQLAARARELETKLADSAKQIEEAKKAAPSNVDPERLNYLERLSRVYERENHPQFQAELKAKQETADNNLIAVLKAHGLSDDAAKEMTEGEGLDRYSEEWWEKEILSKLPALGRQRVLRALEDRAAIPEWKAQQLDAIAKDAETFANEGRQNEEKFVQGWTGALQKTVGELSKGHDWANMKQIPANATAEQKAAIEAHNKEVSSRAENYKATVTGIFQRDPQVAARAAFAVERVPILEKDLAAKTSENADLQKRVDELEALVGKARTAGKMTTKSDTTPPPPAKKNAKGIDLGGTTEQVAPDFSIL